MELFGESSVFRGGVDGKGNSSELRDQDQLEGQ